MNADRIIEIFLGLLTVAVGYSSFYLATRSAKVQGDASAKAVDAAAFERAREIYESALDAIRKELTDTRNELRATRDELNSTRNVLITARGELFHASREIDGLRVDIVRLEHQISGRNNP